jgi:hypothetical protein
MSLLPGLKAAHMAETLVDYGRADATLTHTGPARPLGAPENDRRYSDDEQFWREILLGGAWDSTWHIEGAAISEWLARVPGLYWAPGSAAFRRIAKAFVEHRDANFVTYQPIGKSQRVIGGIGTLRLPPADDGYRIVTLTTSLNASTGVPALVSPDTWSRLHLREGSIVSGRAWWVPMSVRWAENFPSVKHIPRGYLLLDDGAPIHAHGGTAHVEIQPFSLMEYWDGNAELLDYVYVTADGTDAAYRRQCEGFFERYRAESGRSGRYLLSADVADPMWDAVYASPAALRGAYVRDLELLQHRIDRASGGEDVVASLIGVLSSAQSAADLRRLGDQADVPGGWYGQAPIAELSRRLVAAAANAGRLPSLVQQAAIEYPRQVLSGLG